MPPASAVNFYASFSRIRRVSVFFSTSLSRLAGCLAGWPSRNFHYYSEILLDDTIITEIYETRSSAESAPLRKILSRMRMGIFVVHPWYFYQERRLCCKMVEFGNITIGEGGGGWKRYKRVAKLKSKDKSLFLIIPRYLESPVCT